MFSACKANCAWPNAGMSIRLFLVSRGLGRGLSQHRIEDLAHFAIGELAEITIPLSDRGESLRLRQADRLVSRTLQVGNSLRRPHGYGDNYVGDPSLPQGL